MKTSTQFCTTHFFIGLFMGLGVGQCENTIPMGNSSVKIIHDEKPNFLLGYEICPHKKARYCRLRFQDVFAVITLVWGHNFPLGERVKLYH